LSEELIAFIHLLQYNDKNIAVYDVDQIEPVIRPQPNVIPTRIPHSAPEESSPETSESHNLQVRSLKVRAGEAPLCGIGAKYQTLFLTTTDVRQLTLAADGAREFHSRPLLGSGGREEGPSLDDLLGNRISYSKKRYIVSKRKAEFLTQFALMPLLFGALNLAGLGYTFTAHIERILWVAACASIMILELLAFYAHMLTGRNCALILTLLMLFEVVIARLYLIVESFYSLRSVSIGVYVTVDWLNAIPHL
jgi:hypothetical protein